MKSKNQNLKSLGTSCSTEVLSTVVKKKGIACLLIGRLLYKVWNIRALEYYAAVKNHSSNTFIIWRILVA